MVCWPTVETSCCKHGTKWLLLRMGYPAYTSCLQESSSQSHCLAHTCTIAETFKNGQHKPKKKLADTQTWKLRLTARCTGVRPRLSTADAVAGPAVCRAAMHCWQPDRTAQCRATCPALFLTTDRADPSTLHGNPEVSSRRTTPA